jgi:hypothetical protein
MPNLTRIPGTWVGVDLDKVAETFSSEFFKRWEAGGEKAVEEWMAEIKDRLDSIPKEMCKLLGHPIQPTVV